MFYCLTAINTGGVVMHNLCIIVIDSTLSLSKNKCFFFVFLHILAVDHGLQLGVKWALGFEKVGYNQCWV